MYEKNLLIPVLGRQISELQDSLIYTEKPCLKSKRKKKYFKPHNATLTGDIQLLLTVEGNSGYRIAEYFHRHR